jgi:hypothetical protein
MNDETWQNKRGLDPISDNMTDGVKWQRVNQGGPYLLQLTNQKPAATVQPAAAIQPAANLQPAATPQPAASRQVSSLKAALLTAIDSDILMGDETVHLKSKAHRGRGPRDRGSLKIAKESAGVSASGAAAEASTVATVRASVMGAAQSIASGVIQSLQSFGSGDSFPSHDSIPEPSSADEIECINIALRAPLPDEDDDGL